MAKFNRTTTFVAAGVVVMSALTGCAGEEQQSTADLQRVMSDVGYSCDAPDQATITDISIVAFPIVSNGAIYAGVDEGFFEKHGLKADIQTVSTIPATVAAVQGGTADFAFTTTVSAYQAIDQGIPLAVVAPFAGIAPGYWDKMQAGEEGFEREITAIMVAPDSGIEDPGDLDGKTVAVSDAKGQSELTTRYVIEANGGDPDSVSYTVMSPADAANALMAGQVDAAFTSVPQMLGAEAAGYKVISWAGVETFHEGPTSVLVSSNDFVLNNPETVARFNCAMREATAFANENPDEIRAITAREQDIDPAALATAVVPYFYDAVDVEGLERFYQIMKDQNFVTEDFDIDSVVIPQALS